MIFGTRKASGFCWIAESLMHMKTSLRKMRAFSLHHRHDHGSPAKDQRHVNARPLAELDELAQATRDMQDMRDCYDSLLAAAAASANSAYELSESMRVLASFLLEKAAMNDDEESGKVLIMLGKAQFELQRLVDNYRLHVFQTMTAPSESLLNELQTVEDMRRQCGEKRDVYEYMAKRHRDDAKPRSAKGDDLTKQQVQEAHDEYDEEVTLFVFRLKSLKRGQSRSLLTQAARHHAAQLRFFKMACKTLEEVDPLVKLVSEQQHIDYHFSELNDDGGSGDSENDENDSSGVHDERGFSFDYGETDQDNNGISESRNKTEDDLNISQEYHGDNRTFSQSAPIFAEKTLEPTEKIRQLRQSSSKKFHAYVLPTPVDRKGSASVASSRPVISKQTSLNLRSQSSSNSALEPKGDLKILGDKFSRSSGLNVQSFLKESNNNYSEQLLPPSAGSLLLTQYESYAAPNPKKTRRHALSGPLINMQSDKPSPVLFSGPVMRNTMLQPPPSSSPKVSPLNSPTLASSPKINELHELPRPPADPIPKFARPLGLTHSDQLGPRKNEISPTNKTAVSTSMSPLPRPPHFVRSFSIPARGPAASKLLEASSIMEVPENVITRLKR